MSFDSSFIARRPSTTGGQSESSESSGWFDLSELEGEPEALGAVRRRRRGTGAVPEVRPVLVDPG